MPPIVTAVRRLVAVGLLLVIVGWGLWRGFAAMAVATADQTSDAGQAQLARYDRLRAAAAALAEFERAGYAGIDSDGPEEPFHFARLAAIPCVLHPTKDEPIVLLNFHDDGAIDAWLLVYGGEPLWRSGDGLAVVRREPR
jgi:hypothetical protein